MFSDHARWGLCTPTLDSHGPTCAEQGRREVDRGDRGIGRMHLAERGVEPGEVAVGQDGGCSRRGWA